MSQIYAKLQSGEEWITAKTLGDAYTAVTRFADAGLMYRVVAGNTGTGMKFF